MKISAVQTLKIASLSLGLFLNIASPKAKNFTPPGTVALKGSEVFMDKTEVLNKDWSEYLFSLEESFGADSEIYQNALPNVEVWQSVYDGDVEKYNGLFANYPVVGITYKQAAHYCRWRSERVNEKYSEQRTTYRLPTSEEWQNAFSENKCATYQSKLQAIKRNRKIAGLCDNVSEMTSERSVAIGGNWKSEESEATIRYSESANWLGFRCVAEVSKSLKTPAFYKH